VFDPDIRHYRPTARTLNDAFGPYSKLHVEKQRGGWLWAIAYGVVIGIVWYGIVAMKAGA
jgi:hypothetical protein